MNHRLWLVAEGFHVGLRHGIPSSARFSWTRVGLNLDHRQRRVDLHDGFRRTHVGLQYRRGTAFRLESPSFQMDLGRIEARRATSQSSFQTDPCGVEAQLNGRQAPLVSDGLLEIAASPTTRGVTWRVCSRRTARLVGCQLVA